MNILTDVDDAEVGERYDIAGNGDAKRAAKALEEGYAVRLFHTRSDGGEFFTDHVNTEDGMVMYNQVWYEDEESRMHADNPLDNSMAEFGYGVANAVGMELYHPEDTILNVETF